MLVNSQVDRVTFVGISSVLACFMFRYRAESKGPFYGGPLVDKAVNSVFAALIWHTQEIREELLPFGEIT